MKTYRIAYGRFMQETNSFSPVLTTAEDFKRTHYLEGRNLEFACHSKNTEVKGFLKNLELSGFIKATNKNFQLVIETVPLISTWSISGGPVEKSFFDDVCNRFMENLTNAGDLDAVFLALHGAMGVEGVADPETYLVKKIKNLLGENIPVIVTMDLHANITNEKFNTMDLIFGYQTNPHRDMDKTGFRAGDVLIKMLTGEVKPTKTWRYLPMIMGGGTTIDLLQPMRKIFKYIKKLQTNPKILSCNVFMCHPFLSDPDLGWSVYVITDNDQALAETIAEEIADMCWSVRDKKPPEFIDIDTMITEVKKSKLARKFGCITVCDVSDVVGAGGTGENTVFLKELLTKGKDFISYIPLRDPDAVNTLWDKEINEEVEINVGGKLQPEINEPVSIKGKVLLKKDTDNFARVVVIDLNHIKLVLTEGYAMPMKPSFYEDLGLSTFKADVVITKNFFHFRIYFLFKSRKTLYVKTKGITDLNGVFNINTNDPIYPKDDITDWRKIDAIKRKIPENVYPSKQIGRLIKNENKIKKITIFTILFLLVTLGFYFFNKFKSNKKK